jgi:hypothetical protein
MVVKRSRAEGKQPNHWYRHYAGQNQADVYQGDVYDVCLARDVIEADGAPLENPCEDELVVICSSCGHWCHALHSGFKGTLGCLRETYCPNCLTACFRETLVIAPRQFAKEQLTLDLIQQYIQDRMDSAAWSGGVGNVQGFSELMPEFAAEFQLNDCGIEWSNNCPACGTISSEAELDFHHWDYDDDIGCQLCRECHTYIHGGMTAAEQTEETGRPWQFEAAQLLLDLSVRNGLSFGDIAEFNRRYNMPLATTAADAAEEVFG